jgi:hypothetical protein
MSTKGTNLLHHHRLLFEVTLILKDLFDQVPCITLLAYWEDSRITREKNDDNLCTLMAVRNNICDSGLNNLWHGKSNIVYLNCDKFEGKWNNNLTICLVVPNLHTCQLEMILAVLWSPSTHLRSTHLRSSTITSHLSTLGKYLMHNTPSEWTIQKFQCRLMLFFSQLSLVYPSTAILMLSQNVTAFSHVVYGIWINNRL